MSTDVFPSDDLMNVAVSLEGREMDLLAEIRATDPVFWNEPSSMGPGFWSLTRYADVKLGATEATRLSSAQGTQIMDRRVEGHGAASLHNMDDPEHAKLRKITIPHLRQTKIKQWQEIIDRTAAYLVDEAVAQDGVFDLVGVVAARMPMLVLAQVLGVPEQDAPKMVDWTNRLTSSDPDDVVDADALAAARTEVLDYFARLSEKRRANPSTDLVSILVTGEKDGVKLTWEELAAYYIVLVAAGNETTRQLIAGGTIALHETPGAWDRLETEDLLDSAIEEMLRYVSPVSGLRRTATEDLEIGGKTIRAGDRVMLWFSAANRDPEVFEAPDEFRIDRTPNDHLSFGWGVHFCLGAHLARAEGKALFAEVLRRGIRFELAGEPTRVGFNIFRAWREVPVRVVPAGAGRRG